MSIKEGTITAEDFDKLFILLTENEKNQKYVFFVGTSIMCPKCKSIMDINMNKDDVTCETCGEVYPLK